MGKIIILDIKAIDNCVNEIIDNIEYASIEKYIQISIHNNYSNNAYIDIEYDNSEVIESTIEIKESINILNWNDIYNIIKINDIYIYEKDKFINLLKKLIIDKLAGEELI